MAEAVSLPVVVKFVGGVAAETPPGLKPARILALYAALKRRSSTVIPTLIAALKRCANTTATAGCSSKRIKTAASLTDYLLGSRILATSPYSPW
jgi:hypothetical protein